MAQRRRKQVPHASTQVGAALRRAAARLVQPKTRVTRAAMIAGLKQVEGAARAMPAVIYATRHDDDSWIGASADREQFEDGATVGIYDLREVRTQHVTRTLVPYEAKRPNVQLPPGTVIAKRRRRRARVTR